MALTPIKPQKKRKRQSSPFRRVKSEEVTLLDTRLGDRMAVDVKGGVVGWGKRAHDQLKTVKGKKFTVRNQKFWKKIDFAKLLQKNLKKKIENVRTVDTNKEFR